PALSPFGGEGFEPALPSSGGEGADRNVKALRHFLDAIKFEHTVFALPFAYIAMVLAANGWPGWRVLVWVTLAMVGGRTLAMSVNRLADRVLDAQNPRTAGRHLPTGALAPMQVGLAAAVSAA